MNRSSEFDLIKRFFSPLTDGASGAFGLTNDAAVWRPTDGCDAVITTDCLIAGVHFFFEDPPELVGEKLLAVNLSDIAAMGARPSAYTLTAIFSDEINDSWIASFATGLRYAQEKYALDLLGGDTVRTPGPVTLSLTVFGNIEKGSAIPRGGARANDDIYVSGNIGDAALGLQVLRGELFVKSKHDAEFLIQRYRRPQPRLKIGSALVGIASSAIDVSDGLSADLGHVARQSSVDIDINLKDIPLSEAAKECVEAEQEFFDSILGGGDDYELAFSANINQRNAISELRDTLKVKITKIGKAVEARDFVNPKVQFLDTVGENIFIKKDGYRHF
tara:strand:- start:1403 stop:2398 length:996 start_codon:yes stop_codon:yes gene_type:complete